MGRPVETDLLFGISGAVPAYRTEHPLGSRAAGAATTGLSGTEARFDFRPVSP
jgi:hypothetical protein